jgi:hypothetical protein
MTNIYGVIFEPFGHVGLDRTHLLIDNRSEDVRGLFAHS